MAIVLEAVRRLREHWAQRPAHPYLSAGDCVPTIVAGGEWLVSYPASCTLECHIEYLPDRRRRARLRRARRAGVLRLDRRGDCRRPVAARASARDRLGRRRGAAVRGARRRSDRADAARGRARPRSAPEPRRADTGHDGATLTVEAGIPAVCFRPDDDHRAHTVDEYVVVDDIVAVRSARGRRYAFLRLTGGVRDAGARA